MSSEDIPSRNINAKSALLHILSIFDTVLSLDEFVSVPVTTRELGTKLCECVVLQLGRRKFDYHVLHSLNRSVHFLVDWFFPAGYKTFRTSPSLESLLSVLMSYRSFLWIRSRWWTKHGRRILRLFTPEQQKVLSFGVGIHDVSLRACLQELMEQQLLFFRSEYLAFGLYQWWGPGWRYVGIGGITRRSLPHQGGLSHRLIEHLLGVIRKDIREGYKLRYRLARRHFPWESHFCLCETGSEMYIRARESLEISMHRPSANGMPLRSGRHKTMRARPRQRVTPHTFYSPSAVAQHSLDKCFYNVVRQRQRQQEGNEKLANFWDLVFVDAYRRVQKQWFCKDGLFGPLSLHDPTHRRLLLLHLASSRVCHIDWSLVEKLDAHAVVRIALLLKHVKIPHRRLKAKKRLDPWLVARGYFDTKVRLIEVTNQPVADYAKHVLSICMKSMLVVPIACVRLWTFSRFKIVVKKPRTFMDSWKHTTVAKEHVPTMELHDVCFLGPSVRQIEKDWKIEVRPACLDDELRSCIDAVLLHFGDVPAACVQSLSRFLLGAAPVPGSVKQRWAYINDTVDLYEAYSADFHFGPLEVVIPDDKAKKSGWIMPRWAYIQLLCTFCMLAHTWTLLTVDVEAANAALCRKLLEILGDDLFKRVGLSMQFLLVPYVYGTMKSKCWNAGVKICQKSGHSCIRKIVSYFAWPKKHVWRSAHRALETIAKHFGDTRDTWSLADASERLRQGMHSLTSSSGTCYRCGHEFSGCAGLVADAGQCFEMIQAQEAVSEAHVLLRRFQAISQSSYVTIQRSKKRVGWVGRSNPHNPRKNQTWDVAELYRLFAAAMSVDFASVCQRVFRTKGVPIGGLMSKIAATIVLGAQERRWLYNHEKRASHGFAPGFPWHHAVCHLRFIDDVILLSRCYCRSCLACLLDLVYTVPFDCLPEEDMQLAWLDMRVDLVSWTLGLNVKVRRLPPEWGSHPSYVKSLLCCTFRRWLDIRPPVLQWQRACLSLLVDFRQSGWSSRGITRSLFLIGNKEFEHFILFCRIAWKEICQ